ncbi:hypothetical protein ACFL3S_04585 [Gemmatimonadota bacterium]
MKRSISPLVLLAVLLVGPALASAQVRQQGGQRQRRELERRLQARYGQMVQNQLGLSQGDFQVLQGVMQSFREDRMTLSQSQASLRHRLRDPELPNLGDSDAMDILREMVRLQEEELDLYRREQEQLLSVLSPSQLVLFYRLREQMGQQVQQLRGGRGPGGVGQPGSGLGLGGVGGVF